LKKKVKTLPILALSIPIVNQKTTIYKTKEQNIYNLSQNGAYFDDTIAFNISDLDEKDNLDKNKIRDDIAKVFDKYSTSKLDDLEKKQIELKTAQILKFKKLLESFKTSPISNDDIFLISFENFVSVLFKDAYYFELWEILTTYLLIISSYIDDLVSTKEVKNKKKHVKKLKQFIVTQLEKIISTYEEDLGVLKATEVT
jgi:hypothetical protein